MQAGGPVIGFIGLGVMGVPMVERLLDRAHEVVVWNRTAGRGPDLEGRGARRAATPAELARQCDLVAICLTDGAAVRSIASGPDGLFSAAPHRVRGVADFSTIDPAVAVDLSREAATVGIGWVDCPVSGGVPAARAGTLIGFAGGEHDDLERLRPLTDALFTRVTAMGGAGTGQLAKLCNQMIVASNVLVMAETLAAAQALGMDATRLPAALAGGFADSKPLQLFGPRMASHTYEPRMGAIGTMRKDAHLALGLGASRDGSQPPARRLEQPMLTAVARLYDSVLERADMSLDDDIASIIRLFEEPSARSA